MIDVEEMLCEICETDKVRDRNIDLIESGILDSYAIIELFTRLEDEGIELQITRIDRKLLHTVKGIETLISEN
ncbi:MAG: phosphopantetheine-binding protein [Clostridiaceae bacterium]|nr:phosphopantetheine-binding protein [Clostridiaceae bacterium]MDD6704353.1 phosphopantetheine-binding protein [Clostridiaceae bacterium]MDY5934428.1 phosphopantetheine-binding protein [Oscillospiraceae bacterium]